jgi:hypothetical protein
MHQDVERLWRKRNRSAVLREAALLDVERQVPELISLWQGHDGLNLGEC